LMKFISPRVLLLISGIGAFIALLLVIYGKGYVGVYALIAVSGFMSLMFPTIYGLGIRGLGNDTKLAGSGLIMAILGGALITSVQGYVSDNTNIYISFFVPLVCFAVIVVYALIEGKLASSISGNRPGSAEALVD